MHHAVGREPEQFLKEKLECLWVFSEMVCSTHCQLYVLACPPVGLDNLDVVVGRGRREEYHIGKKFGGVVENLQGLERKIVKGKKPKAYEL